MPLIFPSFQCEQDIASRRNNTPQHFPIETNSKGAGSVSIAHCLCLVYRIATTPRSYTPAFKTATPMIKGACRPPDPTTMNLANLARYDTLRIRIQPRFWIIDQSIVINFFLQITLTHPSPDTRVHDPHRTAAAPYCRVLTVARSRIAEAWRWLLRGNQRTKMIPSQAENASWHIGKLSFGPV